MTMIARPHFGHQGLFRAVSSAAIRRMVAWNINSAMSLQDVPADNATWRFASL
jgi:hypothetical protein